MNGCDSGSDMRRTDFGRFSRIRIRRPHKSTRPLPEVLPRETFALTGGAEQILIRVPERQLEHCAETGPMTIRPGLSFELRVETIHARLPNRGRRKGQDMQ